MNANTESKLTIDQLNAAIVANIPKLAEGMRNMSEHFAAVPRWALTRDQAILIAMVKTTPDERAKALRISITEARKAAGLETDDPGFKSFSQVCSSICAAWDRDVTRQRPDHGDGTPQEGEAQAAYRERCGAKPTKRGPQEAKAPEASKDGAKASEASKDDPTKDESQPAPAQPFQREVAQIAARANAAGKGLAYWQAAAAFSRDWEKQNAATESTATTATKPETKPAKSKAA